MHDFTILEVRRRFHLLGMLRRVTAAAGVEVAVIFEMAVVQEIRVRGQSEAALSSGSDDHLCHSRESAPLRIAESVEERAADEREDRQHHDSSRDSEPPSPADIILNINDDRRGD
ncbi:hypothetical protein Mapa_007917 [Marchantia paleacea]|nr:hypothetical protein Mapa_007917 [Marchantia paleacea]